MLSKVLEDALNGQINKELYSAYLYLSMCAYCEAANLPGFAHWMRLQAQEEVMHAMEFFDFVNDQGGRVVLKAIDQPVPVWKSTLEMSQHLADHERKVTGLINNLYALAVKENDHATQTELERFITEQVGEEKNARDMVERVKMIGEEKMALLMLDKELGARVPPRPIGRGEAE